MWRGGFFSFVYPSSKSSDVVSGKDIITVYYADYTLPVHGNDSAMTLKIKMDEESILTYNFTNSAGKDREKTIQTESGPLGVSHVKHITRDEARLIWNELIDQGWVREPKVGKGKG